MISKKRIALLLLTLTLSSCNSFTNNSTSIDDNYSSNADTSISTGDNNSDISSSYEEFVDNDKQAPLYDGTTIEVSKIVTNSNGSYIEVDGQPFLYTGTQIRVDAFMNCDELNYSQIKGLFEQASKLGVNCVQIPIEWAKMEIAEDVFNYEYIHEMLSYANTYNLKVEFLWFGTNMCGDTHSYTVPDYILKDGKTYPKFDALRTGEFWNYYGVMWFLDFDNPNLIARESNAVNKMMDYIYEFDSTHGGKKPVIGIQVLNEPDIFARWRIYEKEVLSKTTGVKMTEEEAYQKICNSLNALGKTIKNSKYKVYTRVNLATATEADVNGNKSGIYTGSSLNSAPSFATRFQALEGIDIVGDDSYTSIVKDIKGITKIFANISNNFGHIAENDGNYSNTPSLILAAIAMHGGYSIYDLITSPFFTSNNTSNVDQGIIKFKDNSWSEFTYKSHYTATQNLLNGLKKVGGKVYSVSSNDFAAFNIASDNPATNITQKISTTNVTIEFSTATSAIGFAIDSVNHLDVLVTGDSQIKITNGNVTSVKDGYYQNVSSFVTNNTLSTSNTISLKANTLYRIDYTSSGKITSNTWNYIGG